MFGQVPITTQANGGVRVLMDYENETGLIYNGYVNQEMWFLTEVWYKNWWNGHRDNANYDLHDCPGAWSFLENEFELMGLRLY